MDKFTITYETREGEVLSTTYSADEIGGSDMFWNWLTEGLDSIGMGFVAQYLPVDQDAAWETNPTRKQLQEPVEKETENNEVPDIDLSKLVGGTYDFAFRGIDGGRFAVIEEREDSTDTYPYQINDDYYTLGGDWERWGVPHRLDILRVWDKDTGKLLQERKED